MTREKMNTTIKIQANSISAYLNDFRRKDGGFDTDYIKDMVDNDTFEIGHFITMVDHLCKMVENI